MPKRKTQIPESLQIEIARYSLDHPKMTQYEVGEVFNVTKHQVRYALDKYNRNQFDVAVTEEQEFDLARAKAKVLEDLKVKGAVRLVDTLIVDLIAEIETTEKMPIREKIQYVNQLTTAMKRTQGLLLVDALKKPDAQKVIKLCQKIKPTLTESEIIVLWEQVITDN